MGKSLSRNTIWDLIAPAVPDSLEDLGKGQYLAKWWTPVPMDDVERLLRNKRIKLHLEPFGELPQGFRSVFCGGQRTAPSRSMNTAPGNNCRGTAAKRVRSLFFGGRPAIEVGT